MVRQGKLGGYAALLLLALILSACFRSPAPEPVAPLAVSGLTVENLDGAPFNDRLVFSRIGSLSSPPTNGVHDLVTLRLKNTGTNSVSLSALTFGGTDAADWRLEGAPTLPTSIAAGGQLDLKVRFIASANRRIHNGTLTISSNDAANPQLVVQLAGWWQSVSEGGQEPSLQQIADTFGYKTRIVNSGQSLNQKGLFAAVGDEILSPYWRRADTTQAVTVRQLAAFHQYPNSATVYWHAKGSTTTSAVFGMNGQDAQSLLPRRGSSTPALGSFTPSSAVFGFKADPEWSDWRKNDGQKDLGNGCAGVIPQDCGHHVRFWPAKDRSGTVIPNTYLMSMDYSGINYDYNDNVYLIANITPDTQTTYRLNVAGPAYTDKSVNVWLPDGDFYVPGDAKSEGGITTGIANTEDDTLYRTYRALLPNKPTTDNRVLVYNLPVPPGDYDLKLHFAEIYWNAPGQRVFDVIVEGATLLDNFDILSETNKFSALTKTFSKVHVTDGMLTVRLKAETDYGALSALELLPAGSATLESPTVTGTSPAGGATGVFRNTAIAADVRLPNLGAGVDEGTLSTSTVKLFKTSGGAGVPGTVNTSGGNDAIVYQPSVLLDPSTNYTFQVTSSVKDQAGAAFTPFTMSFTTGTSTSVQADPNVSFTKTSVFSGSPISTLVIGPDGKLYGAGLDGVLHRWQINGNGQLKAEQTFRGLAGKAVVGMTFNPNDTKELYLWTTANEPIYPQPAPDFSGKIYKLRLRGINFFDSDLQLYITGLPRSAKDHLSNSLAFGPDSLLYMTQGGNSAMGAPDSAWYNRPERLLSAAVLQINPNLTTGLPINVQTEPCDTHCQGTGTTGNYDPTAAGAPVKLYATGVRNAYDLVWHSNGMLYVPTNGSAAGGNTPDNPATTTKNEGLTNVATQDDFLFKVVKGGYYGHPNPKRGEYIMNGGNPTSGADPAEVVAVGSYKGYPEGTQPELNYRGFAYNFGRNRSPNGVIEYKSDTFGGRLKGKLLVVEYSAGDDILALPLGSDGNVVGSSVTQLMAGFSDPLDLTEDTRNGNLYVAELIGGGTSGSISLLSPNVSVSNAPPAVDAGVDQTVTFPASANLDATVSDDGKPNNTLTTLWKKVIGPGSVTFGNASAVDTTASFSEVGTYVLELSASDGALANSARVTIGVQAAPTSSQAVTSLSLINADTDQVIRQLVDGDTIDYTALGTQNLNVRADTSPATVGSVSFVLDGKPYRIESRAPYALEGDVYKSNPPDYYPISPVLAVGGHTLQATPYSASGAGGTAGATLTVSFTVTQGAPTNKPPTANFSSSCTNLSCTFTDTSTDSDGTVTAWSWNFGDGATSTTRNPSHSYSTAGTYSVSLTVTDDKGATNTVSKSVSVTAPAPSSQAVVSFTLINADTDGEVGTLIEGMVVDYAALGTSNLSIRANTSPATVGSVEFTLDGSVYRVESYAPYAVAGDGNSGTDYYPMSPILALGSHTLSATPYTDRSTGGSAGTVLTVNFTVRQGAPTNKPPTAAFGSSCTNLNCTFSDQSSDVDGTVTAWSWAFGDGTTSSTRNPSHAYSGAGTYSVTLTVTDNSGATSTASKSVGVTAPATSQAVTSFYLINADTDVVVRQLMNGDTVDYGVLKTSNISIRADTSPATVGSVSFVLDGKPYRIENYAPYSLAGEVWRGGPTEEYYPVDPPLAPGSHTLTATPSTDKYGGGSAGTALTVSFMVTQGTASSSLNWSTVASAPLGLTEAQGAVGGGDLYVFGGYTSFNPVTITPKVSVYDPVADRWASLPDAPTALTHAGVAVDGDTVYVAGGYVGKAGGGQTFATREVWAYRPAASAWTALPPLPAARGGGQLVRLGRVLHYFGGSDLNRADRAEHWQLALDGGTAWASAAPLPVAVNHQGATVLGGNIYSIGGQKGQDSSAVTQTSVYVWNPSAPDRWTAAQSLPKARSHIMSSSFAVNGRLIVIGGDSVPNSAVRDVSAYDPAAGWTALTSLPAARMAGVGVPVGGDFFFATGSGQRTTYRGVAN